MKTTISRDPFAREEFIRETVETSQGCTFCGSVRYHNGKQTHKLFAYGVSPDSVCNKDYIDYAHLFCGVGCYRAYHGQ